MNSREAVDRLLIGLSTRVKQAARDAGFDLCGIAPVRDFGELQVFPAWIADGKHGEMKYMESRDDAGELKRASLRRVAPWARSVIACAINYNTAYPYSTEVQDASRGWISRYAWAREDYHDAVLRRLRKVEDELRRLLGSPESGSMTSDSLQLRSYVDTGPLIERVYAKYAGIGWIGKNTCVINQKLGSWLFLGVILTSLDVKKNDFTQSELAADLPAPDRCGTCTRCIAACPTQAITAPGVLDARLCISYLTIEKRGEIPDELRADMGRHIFGCDICQDVCPWNHRAPIGSAPEFEPRRVRDESLAAPKLEFLLGLTEADFREAFRTSAVRRTKWRGLIRNACVAAGNSGLRPGDAGHAEIVRRLMLLAASEDFLIAEHAHWALSRIQ